MEIKAISVFCGSHFARNPHFKETAEHLGRTLASRGIKLIYGGSNLGYMGAVSAAAYQAGGKVVGVIPSFFTSEVVLSQGGGEKLMVDSMGERKTRMDEMCEAFIALPGGVGTLDEVTEMLTANQLGKVIKPVGMLNVDGFFNPFVEQLNLMISEGLMYQSTMDSIIVRDNVEDMLAALEAFVPGDNSELRFKVQKGKGMR
jgi:TIGR00730 family protein